MPRTRSNNSSSSLESEGTWGQGELYELLVLMVVGACVWFIGVGQGVFDRVGRYIIQHELLNLVMLTACLGVGAVVATIRKSILLRRAIAARMAAEALAEKSARHDALTGLPNRRLFGETLESALSRCSAHETFAVLLIDLDRFKPVNDLHGHAAGNAVLCAVADRLRGLMPRGGVAARVGGDEFVVLVPFFQDRDALVTLVQRINAAVREPVPWNHGQVEVDSTIGVAFATPGDHDPDALLHAADVAMYQGKREGRGTFRFFHSEMDVALRARARLESDLRAAINRGEVRPFYQPIVSLPERDLVGFEALARWDSPEHGSVPPDVFISVAEETGMICDLTCRILREACSDARGWPPNLQLSVNISATQLRDPRLAAALLAILTETGFPSGRLEVEIAETALLSDLEAARAALTSLQNLGVKIALDDFGAGYSNLRHLREQRFNKIKIDKSYLANVEQGGERAKLADAMMQIGASLSLQTTAEGIESDANLDWLSNQGCDFAQGYLFGSAMSKDEADKFIQSGKAASSPPEAHAA
jgi:diguanylate cyclase (GGDEF)-like protein